MVTIYSVNVFGDVLEIVWDGNVFIGSHGQQFSRKADAMESEILDYYSAAGEEISEEKIQEILSTVTVWNQNKKGV